MEKEKWRREEGLGRGYWMERGGEGKGLEVGRGEWRREGRRLKLGEGGEGGVGAAGG